jgi:hypothetical protein
VWISQSTDYRLIEKYFLNGLRKKPDIFVSVFDQERWFLLFLYYLVLISLQDVKKVFTNVYQEMQILLGTIQPRHTTAFYLL